MEMVEVIDDGRIVRVSEEYAKREGLPVIRRAGLEEKEAIKKFSEEELIKRKEFAGRGVFSNSSGRGRSILQFEEYRRPLKRDGSDVTTDLIDNFHWEILKKRKEKGITRKQFASDLNVSEEEVKMIENGRLPRNDFVLISKIQSYFGINLRKDGKDFVKPAREMVEKKKENTNEEGEKESEDIEIVNDEDDL